MIMLLAGFRERFMRSFWMIVLMMGFGAGLGRAQQTAQPADAPVPQDQWAVKKIKPPVPINNIEAEFSDEARAKNINGRCFLSAIIDLNGIPENIIIIHCSDPSFAQNSLAAVAKYRFKPAMTEDGKPVSVNIHIVIKYMLFDRFNHPVNKPIRYAIRYGFSSPPGTLFTEPSADGVYSLTKEAFPPSMANFSDEGYGELAFLSTKGNGDCDIVLTISKKGNASDPQVIHCERPALEKPAINSLLKSKYNPGSMNGKVVPIRTLIHLEYGDVPATP